MEQLSRCPVCLDTFSSKTAAVRIGTGVWGYGVDCIVCGRYDLEREAYDDFLDPQSGIGHSLTAQNRAHISHKLRTARTLSKSGLPRLSSEFLSSYIKDGCPGPSPGQQATNAIRYIGDRITETGEHLREMPLSFYAIIGAANPTFAGELLLELYHQGVLNGVEHQTMGTPPTMLRVNLTLGGWEAYENEKKGRVSGKYGFFALKFGDGPLERFANEVIKPTLKDQLQFELFDMRDVARAGVIDNIMRAQIRDAAFVIVDLTHDNSGAYWEAGYAEGLGKPVIYICEKEKFENVQTHFDTNHCTTVVWSADNPEQFKKQLVATLRRSLDLF